MTEINPLIKETRKALSAMEGSLQTAEDCLRKGEAGKIATEKLSRDLGVLNKTAAALLRDFPWTQTHYFIYLEVQEIVRRSQFVVKEWREKTNETKAVLD